MIHPSKAREFFPRGGRCEAVKVEERDAVHCDFANLDHAPQVDKGLVIDLIFAKQLGVVAEVAQKPTQLPHSPGRAIQPTGHEATGQMLWLEDSEADLVIRFLLVPATLRPIHPNKEQTIRNGVNGRYIGWAERLEIAPHAAPSFPPR